MSGEAHTRAEEVLRALAGAVNVARLYPPSSELPRQAVTRFLAACPDAADGPVRFAVDRKGFRSGEGDACASIPQVLSLAETLHALQIAQLIVAPGVTEAEAVAFVGLVNSDTRALREGGGLRRGLGAAGVERIAVIEVTLRASEEEGIAGLDLTAAPLEEIGRATAVAAEEWARSASQGDGADRLSEALDGLEEAACELAEQRVAEAMMILDEPTRVKLLGQALAPDLCGQRMGGMMRVISRMQPAALARLLRLVAERAGTRPDKLLASLELPEELMRELGVLLSPPPEAGPERGVPAEADATAMAADVAEEDESCEIERQIALSAPQLAAGKALLTTVAVASEHPSLEAIEAIRAALAPAARDGALREVREALAQLSEMESDPALALAAEDALTSLADIDVLTAVCRAPMSHADAVVAGEILRAAGPLGAEALLSCYVEANGSARSLLRPVLRSMAEGALAAASRHMRTADSAVAEAVVRILPDFGDRRAVSGANHALEHLDARVRKAAVTALGEMRSEEATAGLAKALAHWDPETRRFAAREIGRAGAAGALPALLRILEEITMFERNYELKKEVIKSLEILGSRDAIPMLRRIAQRPFVLGRKNKELRFLARNALASLERIRDEKEVAT
ncbi:MAG: HEAT repeat domain-containing protein [Coriobacteriia bacterium]|nr:HEAT repeat domain-containing protein [Coriobacteriia bacterium]